MYNAEKYIGNCLDTLLNQDIPKSEYEIVILDDESKDGSVGIVESYISKNDNIKLFKQKNYGTSITRNNLLKLAKGDYIYNIDNDDYVSHNSLGDVLNIAIEKDLDIIAFDILETTKLDLYAKKSTEEVGELEVTSGAEFWSKSKLHHMAYWWYFIKRDFIEKEQLSFLPNNPMADTLFTFNVFIKARRVVHFPVDIYRYVNVPTSVMNKTNASHLRKMVGYHVELVENLTGLLDELKNEEDSSITKMKTEINFWKDINVYFMFKKFLHFGISRKEINAILKRLNEINAYPMKSFVGDLCFSKQHKYLTKFFNAKALFFVLLAPVRFFVKTKLLNISVR